MGWLEWIGALVLIAMVLFVASVCSLLSGRKRAKQGNWFGEEITKKDHAHAKKENQS